MKRKACALWRGVTIAAGLSIILGVLTGVAAAADPRTYTIETFLDWYHRYANTKPDFKPGDVLTVKDLERIRPFVPPGYFEQLDFPELRMTVAQPEAHPMNQAYIDCTEKYGGQVRLAADGALINYVCGQPFPNDLLDPQDPLSGVKAAWNFYYHWDYLGLNGMLIWVWDRFGGNHNGSAPTATDVPPTGFTSSIKYTSQWPAGLADSFGGGGTFSRTLQSYYERSEYSHIATLAGQGGALPLPGAKDIQWKEFNYFLDPFDIRGTAFITFRYDDPHRTDDSWAYIPALRRVRRISAEVKSDSLLGTDFTLDDFYGFNGRVLDWDWKFIGWKDVLAMTDPVYDFPKYYGPNGTIADDQWTLRRVALLQRIPKSSRYPYKSALMFIADNWFSTHTFPFDRSGKLWKVIQWNWKYTEDSKTFKEVRAGVKTMWFQSAVGMDIQNGRATLVPGPGFGNPTTNPKDVEKLFDPNALEQIHR